jgi:GDP-L-fucose synthase
MASACLHVMNLPKNTYDSLTSPMQSHINVGYGEDISIGDLARLVAKVIGYKGEITFDTDKPDGTPRKLMNSQRLRDMGWQPSVDLETGLHLAYKDFLEHGVRGKNIQ